MAALDRAEGALLVAEEALRRADAVEKSLFDLASKLKHSSTENLYEQIARAVELAVSKIPAPENGKQGDPGRDGRDASDLQIVSKMIGEQLGEKLPEIVSGIAIGTPDDGRTLIFDIRFGDKTSRCEVKTAVVLDKGVWREQPFEKGDGVTWAGSFFVARRATEATEKPGEAPDAWRLSIKRGRDGRDGKEGSVGQKGERGLKGEPGSPGRNWA